MGDRSKWDFATLAAAVAAAVAGGGASYSAKANIKKDGFSRSINLIAQDDDAG